MLWLAVHLPMFALEVSQAGQNTRVPTVLVDGNRILLGNRAALHAGIGLQSTLAMARGICPHLVHCRRDPGTERKHLQLLAEMCYRFTSRVSLELPQGAQAASSLLLEAGGSLKLFGTMKVWQSRVAGLCRELGHMAVLRTAATPSAALVLARAGASRLADVPLIHTELAENEVESLFNMGIKTLGPLLQLPELELGQRFGARLTNYLRRLAGTVPDPRHCIEPRPVFASTLHLLDPITNKGALLFPMQRLLTELQCWLIGRQLGAERLLWHFAPHESAAKVRMPVRFAVARQRKMDFIEIVRLALNRAALPENVLEIGLKAESLVPWTTRNQTLFEPPPDQPGGQSPQPGSARGRPPHEKSPQPGSARGRPPHEKSPQPGSVGKHPSHGTVPAPLSWAASERPVPRHVNPAGSAADWETPYSLRVGAAVHRDGNSQEKALPTELIDRFTAHLGEASCSGIVATRQHVPEQAWRRCRAGRADGSPDSHGRTDRPLWLFASPQRVNREEFEILRGPERLQTGWWRLAEGSCHRDYYVVRYGNGARGWVFVDRDGQWFLHGYFG